MSPRVRWPAAALIAVTAACGAADPAGQGRPVLGGRDSSDRRAVMLYRQDKASPTATRICSGAVLCESFVVTALHCIFDEELGSDPDLVRVTDAREPITQILAGADVPGARRVETMETFSVDGSDGLLFVKLLHGSYFPEPETGGRFFALAEGGNWSAGAAFQLVGYGRNQGGTGSLGSDGSGVRRAGNETFLRFDVDSAGERAFLALAPGALGGQKQNGCKGDDGAPAITGDRLAGIYLRGAVSGDPGAACANQTEDRAVSTVLPAHASAVRQKMQEWCPARSGVRVVPGIFDVKPEATVQAGWVAGAGLGGDGDPDARALVLDKRGATNDIAFAEGSVQGLEPFDASILELGFDYLDTGHCGAGAPRFNVTTADGEIRFFPCHYGAHAPGPQAGWSRVTFTAADADFPFASGDVVVGIRLIMDEGSDTPVAHRVVTPGHAVVDNVRINGAVIGRAGTVY